MREALRLSRRLLVVVATLLLAPPAQAESLLEALGGLGGTPNRVDCDPGSYVVGFSGRAGSWLDQISIICASWDRDRQSLGRGEVRGALGDSGSGDAITETCPDGWAVYANKVRYTWDWVTSDNILDALGNNYSKWTPRFVHAIQFFCRPITRREVEPIHVTFGSWSTGQVTVLLPQGNPLTCLPDEAATGIHGRAGNFVDAIGLVCDQRPEPAGIGVEIGSRGGPIVAAGAADTLKKDGIIIAESDPIVAPAPGPLGPVIADPVAAPLYCRGGGDMTVTALGTVAGEATSTFRRAAAGYATGAPGAGECAWRDRPVSEFEPALLHFQIMGLGVEASGALHDAIKNGGSWEVQAYYDAANGWLDVESISALNFMPPIADLPTPVPEPGPPAAECGPTGGTAVVVIADPNLNKLNVRSAPGGPVQGTIPEGSQVSIVGPCGPAGSVGLAAPGQGTTGSGWCQIDKPVLGCVAAEFLTLGRSGAAGLTAPPPSPPPPPPPAPPAPAPPPAAPVPAETGAQTITVVVTKDANVRSSPKDANNIIGKVTAGTAVIIVGCQPPWCRIDVAAGVEAWVHQSRLAISPPTGGAGQAPPPPPPTPPDQGPIASGCDRPAGLATIVIPEANLDKLNVRESPGGRVITALPEGTQVSIVGECGPENAAGLAAPSGQGGAAGWCQIDQPVTGCVASRYLVPGGGAAGATQAPASTATEAPGFTGQWNTLADGVPHTVVLSQTGNAVTGSYVAADGSQGQISGSVDGNVLRFSWLQGDGLAGTGKFSLSADGHSFTGRFSLGQNPDEVAGSWNGSRR